MVAWTSPRCAARIVANDSVTLWSWFMRLFSASTFKKLVVTGENPIFLAIDTICRAFCIAGTGPE